jgi:hypothetical protein
LFSFKPLPHPSQRCGAKPAGPRPASVISYTTPRCRSTCRRALRRPAPPSQIKRISLPAPLPAAAVDEQVDRLLMHCAASRLLRTEIAGCARFSPWTPRRSKSDASRATRKRRSGGPEGQASAVPAISALDHRDTASGTRARRAPFPASLSGPAARFFEGQPLATGEEPDGSIVSVRIVRPLARGLGGSPLGMRLWVFGPGVADRWRVVDAGRDTQVARDRRRRAVMAGSDTFPDEVGPAARGGRCMVGRRLRSAKVPASPG